MVRQENMIRKNNMPYLWSSNYIGLWIKSHDWVEARISQCYVSDHFLVLFNAPLVSLISFSIPTLAAGAGTIPSRAGYIQ